MPVDAAVRSNTLATDVKISSRGEYLSYIESDFSGSLIVNKVKTIDVNSTKDNSEKSLKHSYDFDSDELLLKCEYKKDNLLVFSNKKCYTLKDGEKIEILEIKENIAFVEINLKEQIAFVEENEEGLQLLKMVNINNFTEREYIERIVYENTGKHLTDQQMINYLDNNLNHNGCGYAAVTNCIFEYYSKQENGEQLFMEKFGFPMKDLNGNYTFNLLITYIFSKYSDYNNPQGLNQDTLKKVLASCMNSKDSSKNVNLKISNNQKITPQNIDDHLRNGDQVVLLGWNVPVYVLDSNGKVERTQICGGHGMVITGVTEDGKYIVSTWGKKAIVDPADIGKTNVKGKCKVSFTVVKY